jgi:flagellin
MSNNISLSSSVRSALSSIQSSQAAAAIQQTRLATGKKVNSAIDNPANFFTASGLNNRASDLGRLLDGIGLGIKTVEAADKGIKAITKLVETAQGAAVRPCKMPPRTSLQRVLLWSAVLPKSLWQAMPVPSP